MIKFKKILAYIIAPIIFILLMVLPYCISFKIVEKLGGEK